MMHPSSVQTGLHSASRPPSQQMAGLSMGPPGGSPAASQLGAPNAMQSFPHAHSFNPYNEPQMQQTTDGRSPFNTAIVNPSNQGVGSEQPMGNFPSRSSHYSSQPPGPGSIQRGPSINGPLQPPSYQNVPTLAPLVGQQHMQMNPVPLQPEHPSSAAPGLAPSSALAAHPPSSSAVGIGSYPSPGGYTGGLPGGFANGPSTGGPPMGGSPPSGLSAVGPPPSKLSPIPQMGGPPSSGFSMRQPPIEGPPMGGPSMGRPPTSGLSMVGSQSSGALTSGHPLREHPISGPPDGDHSTSGYPAGKPIERPPIERPPIGGRPMGGPPIGGPPMGGPPMGGPPIGGPPIGGHPTSRPPMGGPSMGGPPMGGPPMGGPPMGGPPMGGPPMGGPPMGGPPMGGPPMGGPPMGGPPMGRHPMSRPPIGGPSIGGPPASEPPMGGPSTSGPPMGGPSIGGPPTSEPPVSGPPMGGPPMGGPPVRGNSTYGLPTGGPRMGGAHMGGPPMGGPPMGGPPMGGPPMGGPPMGGPPMGGPPMGGPPMGGPPMGGPPMGGLPMGGPPMGGPSGQGNSSQFGMVMGPTGQLVGTQFNPPGMTSAPMRAPSAGHTSLSYGPPGVGGGGPRSPGLPPGPVQQQPRTKIDPDQMPNPVEVMNVDQEQHGATPYLTSTRDTPPPLVTTKFTVKDDGNASPRYLRATMYTVPCSKDLLNGCKIPMGLVIQAFAQVPQNEDTLHLVDCGVGGPIRCNRCKAYMNPFARFVDGGRKYLCPICQCSNDVPEEYFCHLNQLGQRTDAMQRPELSFGSVEYLANKDYCKDGILPRPPAYIFMIDVSYSSIQAGILHLLSSTILGLLDSLPRSSGTEDSPIRVGFVTYDRVIQFYNVKGSMAQPQMMVMTDVDDVFVPMVDGFIVSLAEAKIVLESLMSQLPDMFSSNKALQVVLEPVVRVGMEALKAAGRNGRLFVFHSSLPSAQATGILKNRLDAKLLGTDKEKTLLNPVTSPYQQLAEDCVKYGVAVELFLFSNNFADVATLGSFVSTTGGELHYYKNYTTSSDGERLLEDLRHSLTRPTAFDCVMRVRASTGLRPTGFYGAFFMSNTTDIELGNTDSDKAIAVEIKHDDKLREDENTFFQTALLYTDIYGQRKLRIHNIALGCSSKFSDLFRSCEIDTIMNFLSKSIVTASKSMAYKNIRENFSHQVAIILSCYRKNCSNQSPAGQLILPESLKLLPMYANCLLKSDAILSPPIVSLDEKCWLMYCLLSMPTKVAGAFIYPRMYSLNDLDLNEKGLPPLMRCTGQKLQDSGLYVIDNGVTLVLWVGQQFPIESLQKVFGVPSPAQLSNSLRALPALDNPLSFRLRGILQLLQASQQCSMKLIVSRQKTESEVFFRRLLKEDKGAGQWEGTTYIDFLCQIHREIKEILS